MREETILSHADEALFNTMSGEWRLLEQAALQTWQEQLSDLGDCCAIDALDSATFQTWQERFDVMAEEERTLRCQGQWVSGPADFLSIIDRTRREMYHSDLLAWLMDPCMPHGLGYRFLEALLKRCFPDEVFAAEKLYTVRTQCEVRKKQVVTDQAAIADIVVQGDDFTVVFGVKVDAYEQPEQCNRLYADVWHTFAVALDQAIANTIK